MKQHRLRRLLGACLSAVALVAMVVPMAQADHGSPTFNEYYNGPQGPIVLSGDTYCLAESVQNNTTAAQEGEIRERMENVFDHTANATQMNYNFNVEASGACSGQLNIVQSWNDASGSTFEARLADWCNDRGGGQSRVSYGDPDDMELFSGPIAVTLPCDTDLNGFIDQSFILFDSVGHCDGLVDFPDCYKYDGAPGGSQFYHWRGIFQHEFMHAIGFYGHFVSTGDACDSPKNTMCNGSSGFYNSQASETLESHDIGETNENY